MTIGFATMTLSEHRNYLNPFWSQSGIVACQSPISLRVGSVQLNNSIE